ncbi:hypothetical protein FE257_002504 [Aspergillus nanangensis]|uniref:GPI anchored cell wall protein n=1 Tax=Aspergillus nanangensis TaxID=2582783 RepID=A0AAD4CUN7_ASPNN|nr:hypothetical protein FE257_002504 [Aspergillus nanangensis]
MPSTKSLLLAAALAASSVAQTTTTEIKLFNAADISIPSISMVASVIGGSPEATTLAIECGGHDACSLDSPMTVTQGPSTFAMDYSFTTKIMGVDGTGIQHQDCKITGSTENADCAVTITAKVESGDIKTSTVMSTTTAYGSDDIVWTPVKVTAGVENMNKPAPTESPEGAAVQLGFSGAAAAVVAAAALIL